MRKTKLLTVVGIIFCLNTYAQQKIQNLNQIESFDEKKAYKEAVEKGIPESDRKGYVNGYLKREFEHSHSENLTTLPLEVRKSLPKYYNDPTNKTTYVNQIGRAHV